MSNINCCRQLRDAIDKDSFPLTYDDHSQEVQLLHGSGDWIAVVRYCPFCGEKLESGRSKLFSKPTNVDREAHLRRVIDNTAGFIAVLAPDGTLLEVNKPAIEVTGLTRDDVIGRKFWDTYWWNFDEGLMQELREAIERVAAGEVIRKDLPYRIADDQRRIVDFNLIPVKNADDNVTHLVPSGVDITERVRTESELAVAKSRLDLSLEIAEVALWSWDMQTNEVVPNPILNRLFGFDEDALPALAEYLDRIDPADQQRVSNAVEKSTKDGAVYDEEYAVRLPDGEERHLRARGSVRTSNNGEVQDFFGVVIDITERKRHELELAKREAHLRRVINNQLGLVGVIGRDGKLLEVDDDSMRIAGLTRDDVIGKHFAECAWWTYDEAVSQKMRESMDKSFAGEIVRYDVPLYAAGLDGPDARLMIDFMMAPVFDDHGEVEYLIPSGVDISERHKAEETLKETQQAAEAANEAKSAFLANMSHEIRTPMTAILGYADLMTSLVENQEALRHLQTIRRNGDFLLSIINDILDLSKIEAGKLDVVSERFSPVRMIEEVRSVMHVRASENNLTLEVKYKSRIPSEINSDPRRLRQILINLVGNAIKFTKKGGVEIGISFAENELRIDINDSGIGMSESQQQRLFQPFSQGDHSVSREFGGTGLGLAISQRLAELLGGSIAVESEEGTGSSFTLSIAVGNIDDVEIIDPMTTLEPEVVAPPPEAVELDCHILVVDDRRDVRFLSRKFLSDAGATVGEAEDGELALAAVTESISSGVSYDLIVLDMQMPRLDGYQTAKALRDLGYSGPIIALTADAMHGDMTRCIEAGCNAYLSKPINKIDLLRKVKAFVDK